MASNPFAYLRGAAAVMAHDLQWQPMVGASVQACGDCHLMNFGAFATPEDNILFDINDFDETLPGVDFTVDLKRLAASIAVAAADLGLAAEKRHALAAAAVRAYRKRMDSLSYLTPLEIWHSRIDLESEARKFRNAALRRKIEVLIARARGEGLDRDDNFPTSRRIRRAASSTTRRRASSISRRIRTRPRGSTRKADLAALSRHARAGGPHSARPLRAAGFRVQGGGRRLGRHLLLCRPVHDRRRRADVSADEGGRSIRCSKFWTTSLAFRGHQGRSAWSRASA